MPAHMLSFDVEEYFQVEAASACGIGPADWHAWEQRVAGAVERILQLLCDHAATATFFVLGWVARHQPDVVRGIARAGCEVASHGMTHTMLGRLQPPQLRRELLDSRTLLEDLAGQGVVGYRAPTFSVTHRTAWALDVLAEAGFEYDSSVFPVHHDRYGVPDAPSQTHWAVTAAGTRLLEIPPLTYPAMGANWPVGGGGYLRLLPAAAAAAALRRQQRRGRAGMLYLHPWEIDPGQPVLPMRRVSRWRHRVGLGRTERKLRYLLERFRFASVRESLAALRSGACETYLYGPTAARRGGEATSGPGRAGA